MKKTNWRERLNGVAVHVLFLGGCAAVAVGAGILNLAAGFITGGALAMVAAVLMSGREEEDDRA